MIRFVTTQIGVGSRGPYYRVDLESEVLLARTFKPFHDACRALVARGHTGPAEQWRDGKLSMSTRDIERTAGFTVTENETHGPRITKYVPFERPE